MRLICVAIVGFGVVIGIFVRSHVNKPPIATAGSKVAVEQQAGAHVSTPPSASRSVTSPARRAATQGAPTAAPAVASTYKQRLKGATDYLQFSRSILPAAKVGNADAEYLLWQVMLRCKHAGDAAFAHYATMDEAEQEGARLGVSMEEVHKGYNRCHGFYSEDVSDLGDEWDWLNRAVKDGQPDAEEDAAQFRMTQQSFKARGVAVPWMPQERIGGDAAADPAQLVLKALQSGDPDVVLGISGVIHDFHPAWSAQDKTIQQYAWTLVGCQRGADCTECGYSCDTNNIMKWAGNDWPAVQNRAQQINDQLDAGQWSEALGFSTDGDVSASASPGS